MCVEREREREREREVCSISFVFGLTQEGRERKRERRGERRKREKGTRSSRKHEIVREREIHAEYRPRRTMQTPNVTHRSALP